MNKYELALARLNTLVEKNNKGGNAYCEYLNALSVARGDVETLQELVNKQTPMKPEKEKIEIRDNRNLPGVYLRFNYKCKCGKCGENIYLYDNYCSHCGQKIERSEGNE